MVCTISSGKHQLWTLSAIHWYWHKIQQLWTARSIGEVDPFKLTLSSITRNELGCARMFKFLGGVAIHLANSIMCMSCRTLACSKARSIYSNRAVSYSYRTFSCRNSFDEDLNCPYHNKSQTFVMLFNSAFEVQKPSTIKLFICSSSKSL